VGESREQGLWDTELGRRKEKPKTEYEVYSLGREEKKDYARGGALGVLGRYKKK